MNPERTSLRRAMLYRHRKAISLFELLVVMSISVVVLSAASGIVHTTLRADRRARTELDLQRSAERLCQQLRRDAHQMVDVQLTTPAVAVDDETLALTDSHGRRVEYSFRENVARRQETGDGEPARHEEFTLPSDYRFVCGTQTAPPRVSIGIWRIAQATELNPTTRLIEHHEIGRRLVGKVDAVIGRHGRYAARGSTSSNGDNANAAEVIPNDRDSFFDPRVQTDSERPGEEETAP